MANRVFGLEKTNQDEDGHRLKMELYGRVQESRKKKMKIGVYGRVPETRDYEMSWEGK